MSEQEEQDRGQKTAEQDTASAGMSGYEAFKEKDFIIAVLMWHKGRRYAIHADFNQWCDDKGQLSWYNFDRELRRLFLLMQGTLYELNVIPVDSVPGSKGLASWD
jgi:hypothetical protein